MLNNYSNYSCGKMNVSTKITQNKQNWKKQKMNIKVLQFKYSGISFFCLSALLNNKNLLMMWTRKKHGKKKTLWFNSAKQTNSTSVGKQKGGKTKNTAQTRSSEEKSIMGEFPEKNEVHLSHRWHAMWERQKEMGRVREMQTDTGRYIGRDVRDVGGKRKNSGEEER